MPRRANESRELRKYFVLAEDGYYVYWPPQEKRGALGSRHLRWIADELDKANETMERKLQATTIVGESDASE